MTFFMRFANGECPVSIGTFTIGTDPDPTVDLGPDVTICEGESTTLAAALTGGQSPFQYLWSTTETSASITVSPTITTVYSVTVTDDIGCVITDDITVNVDASPEVLTMYEVNDAGFVQDTEVNLM